MNKAIQAVIIVIGTYVFTKITMKLMADGLSWAINAVNELQAKYEEYQCRKLFKEVYNEIDGRTAA